MRRADGSGFRCEREADHYEVVDFAGRIMDCRYISPALTIIWTAPRAHQAPS